MKGADVFCGLIPDLQQPHKTTISGGQMKCEINRAFVSGAKNLTFGVAGGLANPTALNYAVQSEGVSLETDLTNFNLNVFNKVDGNTSVAVQAGWKMGASDATFGFAAKRSLACGADTHFKTTGNGACEVAHVSTISPGVKLTMSTGFNALKIDSEAPKWGMGLEFTW